MLIEKPSETGRVGRGVRGSMSQWQHGYTFFIYLFTFYKKKEAESAISSSGPATVSIVGGRRFIVATCVIDMSLKNRLSVTIDC